MADDTDAEFTPQTESDAPLAPETTPIEAEVDVPAEPESVPEAEPDR